MLTFLTSLLRQWRRLPTPPGRSSARSVPPPRLLLIEFNELSPPLVQRFMDAGDLPNFRRLYQSSLIYTTDAGESHGHLEPWIQWPTVHTGLPYRDHGVFHLGDGRKMTARGVATWLSEAGIRVGICGSMNTNYAQLDGYILPDPWDKNGEAWPDELHPYARIVSSMVQEASRYGGASRRDQLRLAGFLVRHGLTPATAWMIVKQLLRERLDPGHSWRRACVLEAFQYDLFRFLNQHYRVRFATFFANSTAHFQHYYWRNMEPERFPVPPPASDHPSLRDAIRDGYRAMDRLLGRIQSDYPDAVLMLATALSQQPWTDTTKCTYRPRDFEQLLRFAGIPARVEQIRPVMAAQFFLDCANATEAETYAARFRELRVDGEALMQMRREGRSLFLGCGIHAPQAEERTLTCSSTGTSCRFGDLFHLVHTMRSGRHHPDGLLWIRTGLHHVESTKVPLTCVAPTILRHFGVAVPFEMKGAPLPLRTARIAA